MSIPYKIDPVKATCAKYDCTDQGIQGINDTCFGICAAYSGTYDTFDMDPNCSEACTALVEQRKREIFGVGSCDHQVPYRPVFWDQVPRYVPILLKKGMKPEQALQKCNSLCESVQNLKEECQENCQVDFNALDLNNNNENKLISTSKLVLTKKNKKDIEKVVLVLFLIVILFLIFKYFPRA